MVCDVFVPDLQLAFNLNSRVYSIVRSINPSINQSIHPSINQAINVMLKIAKTNQHIIRDTGLSMLFELVVFYGLLPRVVLLFLFAWPDVCCVFVAYMPVSVCCFGLSGEFHGCKLGFNCSIICIAVPHLDIYIFYDA